MALSTRSLVLKCWRFFKLSVTSMRFRERAREERERRERESKKREREGEREERALYR